MQKTQLKKNYKVKRIGSSPYFKSNFLQNEKSEIEKRTGLAVLDASPSNDFFLDLPEIVITNTHNKLNSNHLEFFKNVELIIHANSGYDNFDINFIKNFKGQIIIGNQIRSQAVSNYILSAIFNHYSPLHFIDSWDKERKWKRKLINELSVLIIGMGQIGTLVQKALAHQVRSLDLHDPYKGHDLFPLKKEYDLIILASGLNQSNIHLINEDTLKNLKSDGLFINTSRGELVNTKHLIHFLKKHPHSCAILDVFEQEPFDANEFKELPNLKKTSHIAGVFENIDAVTIQFSSEIINDFINGPDNFEAKYTDVLLKNKIINNIVI